MLYEVLYSLFSMCLLVSPAGHTPLFFVPCLYLTCENQHACPSIAPISSNRQAIMFGESASNWFLGNADQFLWSLEERFEYLGYFEVARLIFPFIDIFNTNSQ